MKDFYEVGRVYIWQNAVGIWAHLNGTETTVTGHAIIHDCLDSKQQFIGQVTDTPSWRVRDGFIIAEPGDLRPKHLPPGEQGVRDLFKLPEEVSA